MVIRKIPETLIPKNGAISPEEVYIKLNGLEMELNILEHFIDTEPETPEDGIKLIEHGVRLMEASDYQINPESKLGIMLRELNENKLVNIENRVDLLADKARKRIEQNLLKENIQMLVKLVDREYEDKNH